MQNFKLITEACSVEASSENAHLMSRDCSRNDVISIAHHISF
jgi:hypothetical protein